MSLPAIKLEPGRPKQRTEKLTDMSEVLGFVKGFMAATKIAVDDSRITKRTVNKLVAEVTDMASKMNDPDAELSVPKFEDLKIFD